jgi:acetoin utilization protein AcuB
MTPFPYSIDADASLREARALMDEHGVHHLPVKDDGRIAGMLTWRVVGVDDPRGPVRGALVDDPYMVDLHTSLEQVLHDMARRRLGSVIVTRDGRLVGVFTWVDACRAFAHHLHENFPRSGGNDAA